MEAFEEVLDLGLNLRLLHGPDGLVHVHHYGPLEARHGAGYGVDAVIVRQGTPLAGDVGEPGRGTSSSRGISSILWRLVLLSHLKYC
jgi:hypothetical protein